MWLKRKFKLEKPLFSETAVAKKNILVQKKALKHETRRNSAFWNGYVSLTKIAWYNISRNDIAFYANLIFSKRFKEVLDMYMVKKLLKYFKWQF